MRLTDETGQDDENFVNKMDEMARRISGTESAPIDLYTLVSTAFINWEVLDFHLKDTGLHGMVDSNPKSLFANEIIRTLKKKFRSFKAQGLWNPHESKKVDTEGDLDGLKLDMKIIV